MVGQNPDLVAPQGYTKDQVNYRQHESCKTCSSFNGRVYCTKVEGHISPDCMCNQWSLSEPSGCMTGKQFIADAYEKSRSV